jgi:hypothetical protein
MNIHSNLNSIAPISQDASPTRVGASPANTAESAAVAPATVLPQDEAHLSQAAVLAAATFNRRWPAERTR